MLSVCNLRSEHLKQTLTVITYFQKKNITSVHIYNNAPLNLKKQNCWKMSHLYWCKSRMFVMNRVPKDTNLSLIATEIWSIEFYNVTVLESFTSNNTLFSEKYFTYLSLYMQWCVVLWICNYMSVKLLNKSSCVPIKRQ